MQIASLSFWGLKSSRGIWQSWDVKANLAETLEIRFHLFYVRCDSGRYYPPYVFICNLHVSELQMTFRFYLPAYNLACSCFFNIIAFCVRPDLYQHFRFLSVYKPIKMTCAHMIQKPLSQLGLAVYMDPFSLSCFRIH